MAKNPLNSSTSPERLLESVSAHNTGIPAFTITLGSEVLEIKSCCGRAQEAVFRLFEHVESDQVAETSLLLIGSECSEKYDLSVSWEWNGFAPENFGGRAHFSPEWNSLFIADRQGKRHALVSRGLPGEQFGRREIMRLILRPLLDERGVLGVHGASLGNDTDGVLLTNKGGSGKSTLVAQGLQAGMKTTGDDFLLLRSKTPITPNIHVYSYFSNLKISPSSPAVNRLALEAQGDEEKSLAFIARDFPNGLVVKHNLKAVVIPTIDNNTALDEASRQECLLALLPSSVVLTARTRALIEAVELMIETLPLYRLSVGPDPSTAIPLIEKVLSP